MRADCSPFGPTFWKTFCLKQRSYSSSKSPALRPICTAWARNLALQSGGREVGAYIYARDWVSFIIFSQILLLFVVQANACCLACRKIFVLLTINSYSPSAQTILFVFMSTYEIQMSTSFISLSSQVKEQSFLDHIFAYALLCTSCTVLTTSSTSKAALAISQLAHTRLFIT